MNYITLVLLFTSQKWCFLALISHVNSRVNKEGAGLSCNVKADYKGLSAVLVF